VNRDQHLKLADAAVTRAEQMAGHAENFAHSGDQHRHKVGPYAAAAAAWADIARTRTAIAAVLPKDTDETLED